jgi:hypothetical protein
VDGNTKYNATLQLLQATPPEWGRVSIGSIARLPLLNVDINWNSASSFAAGYIPSTIGLSVNLTSGSNTYTTEAGGTVSLDVKLKANVSVRSPSPLGARA